LQKILAAKNEKVKTKAPPAAMKDPYIEQEEMELARLGKLLGIDKRKFLCCKPVKFYFYINLFAFIIDGSKKKAASKLNKEFDLYEVPLLNVIHCYQQRVFFVHFYIVLQGMGEDFGDFLMDLDDLTDMIEGKGDKKAVFYKKGKKDDEESDDEGKSGKKRGGHLIDEDEQEESDIDDELESENDFSDEDEEELEEDEEEYDGSGSGSDIDSDDFEKEEDDESNDGKVEEGDSSGEEGEKGEEDDDELDGESEEEGGGTGGSDDDEDDDEDDEDEDSDGDSEADSEAEKEKEHNLFTYQPTKGQDIYGRSTDADAAGGGGTVAKYVPPALRKAALMEVNEVMRVLHYCTTVFSCVNTVYHCTARNCTVAFSSLFL
jgi:hypothetical protein